MSHFHGVYFLPYLAIDRFFHLIFAVSKEKKNTFNYSSGTKRGKKIFFQREITILMTTRKIQQLSKRMLNWSPRKRTSRECRTTTLLSLEEKEKKKHFMKVDTKWELDRNLPFDRFFCSKVETPKPGPCFANLMSPEQSTTCTVFRGKIPNPEAIL